MDREDWEDWDQVPRSVQSFSGLLSMDWYWCVEYASFHESLNDFNFRKTRCIERTGMAAHPCAVSYVSWDFLFRRMLVHILQMGRGDQEFHYASLRALLVTTSYCKTYHNLQQDTCGSSHRDGLPCGPWGPFALWKICHTLFIGKQIISHSLSGFSCARKVAVSS